MTTLEQILLYVGGSLLSWIGHQWGQKQKLIADHQAELDTQLEAAVNVYFSPDGGCEQAVCDEISKATALIRVFAYYLTNEKIIAYLQSAVSRGVKVLLVLDEATSRAKSLQDLLKRVEWWIDKKHKIMHDKVMIIDNAVVLTGSFNFTDSAETSNAENLLVLRSPSVAASYTDNWTLHQGHSEKGAT